MSDLNVFLDAPSLGQQEKEYLHRAIDSGYVSSTGPFVEEFEKKITAHLDVEHAVALQSGTAAIYMALHELGLGCGDEVIVPSLTFVATVNPVIYVGAIPVIVDVDSDTWNIDPKKIKEAITNKTKAIIPVHLYGNPCDMTAIGAIAKEYGLDIIEDATESLGASYQGKYTGTFGNFGCFSFNGNKLITTGGGGMIIGKDRKQIEHIRFLANQAKGADDPSFHCELGFNFRMTNIQAALGIAQAKRLEEFLEVKRGTYKQYENFLSQIVEFQKEIGDSSRWICAGKLQPGVSVQKTKASLTDNGVPTRRVFMPIERMPYLNSFAPRFNNNAAAIYEQGICLPSSTRNSSASIDQICDIIKKVVKR